MAFADSDFVKLNLPPGVSFNINGVTMDVPTAVTNALDESGGVREGALATLYAMLESDQVQSETIGRYAYTKWGMRGSDWWKLQAAAKSMNGAVPDVILRSRSAYLGGYC